MSSKKVCAILVDRANYGRLKPVLEKCRGHSAIELSVICAGTMVLERFGAAVNVVERDGFEIAGRVFMELEGSTPATMAKSIGLGIVEFASEFQRLRPDIVLLIGDRYEALSAAIAAAYMNITLVHLQGGEVSGSIDESARHAITKFAHYHVPSTKRSADYLARMGESLEAILTIGCPSSDLAREVAAEPAVPVPLESGSGARIDTARPFLLTVFHPTTTVFGREGREMTAVLNALERLKMPTLMLWPNIDAGSDHISKIIRQFRDTRSTEGWLRLITNLEPSTYLRVLSQAACAVGNSSSFVRDGSYFGTPVVLVGNRQHGRETGAHVQKVAAEASAIEVTIAEQLKKGRYPGIDLYGDGRVSERVAAAIAALLPVSQKVLSYIADEKEVGR